MFKKIVIEIRNDKAFVDHLDFALNTALSHLTSLNTIKVNKML